MKRLLASLVLALALVTPSNAATGVVITKAPGAVGRNRMATLAAKTTPGSMKCTIAVYYKSGPGKAAGLVPKTSAAAGAVIWTWKVGGNTTKGTWPITVTCGGKYTAKSQLTVP